MSCDLFGVGDRCRAAVAFQAQELVVNGPPQVKQIEAGDVGTVREKIDHEPHSHMLYVFWRPTPAAIAGARRADSVLGKGLAHSPGPRRASLSSPAVSGAPP